MADELLRQPPQTVTQVLQIFTILPEPTGVELRLNPVSYNLFRLGAKL